MVPFSRILSDLWPTFQGHDNIQRQITWLIVSRVWSTQWFHFQWSWVTFNLHLLLLLLLRPFVKRKIRINTPNVLSQQLNRNVFSLALKTSSEILGDWTGTLTAKLLFLVTSRPSRSQGYHRFPRGIVCAADVRSVCDSQVLDIHWFISRFLQTWIMKKL